MRTRHSIIFLAALLVLSSCGTARYYADFTKEAARATEMALLGPASVQYYLDKNNKESYDDSLSLVSEALIATLVGDMGLVTQRIELDADQKEEAVAFMRFLTEQNEKMRGNYPIPVELDELLEAQGQRYGLLIYADGMSRDTKGYAKEVAKDVALGVVTAILTGGMLTTYGTSAYAVSHIYTAVLDSEANRVVFYNLSIPTESHPLKPAPVRKQLDKLFKDFLK